MNTLEQTIGYDIIEETVDNKNNTDFSLLEKADDNMCDGRWCHTQFS